jgi:hypothetical protein
MTIDPLFLAIGFVVGVAVYWIFIDPWLRRKGWL